MTQPTRIQRRRTRGWKMPPNTIYIGRPTMAGNPFPVSVYGQARAVDLHRRWITGNMSHEEMSQLSRCDRWSDGPRAVSLVLLRKWVLEYLQTLRGKHLACFCAVGEPCHGKILIELANGPTSEVVP